MKLKDLVAKDPFHKGLQNGLLIMVVFWSAVAFIIWMMWY
jgi:hypothetical protein